MLAICHAIPYSALHTPSSITCSDAGHQETTLASSDPGISQCCCYRGRCQAPANQPSGNHMGHRLPCRGSKTVNVCRLCLYFWIDWQIQLQQSLSVWLLCSYLVRHTPPCEPSASTSAWMHCHSKAHCAKTSLQSSRRHQIWTQMHCCL